MALIFLESICDDPEVIAANVALKVSMGDPDYKDTSREEAKRDFLRRIKEYEAVYEPITEPHLSYFKIINIGDQATVCRIHGYLQSRVAFYLMNLHLKPRSIFFSRVRCCCAPPPPSDSLICMICSTVRASTTWRGELVGTQDYPNEDSNTRMRFRISSEITLAMRRLLYPPVILSVALSNDPLRQVWTSTLKRTIQTASLLPNTKLTWKSLDELDAGVCDGMTYEEIEVRTFTTVYNPFSFYAVPLSLHTRRTLQTETMTSSTIGIVVRRSACGYRDTDVDCWWCRRRIIPRRRYSARTGDYGAGTTGERPCRGAPSELSPRISVASTHDCHRLSSGVCELTIESCVANIL